MILTEEAIRHIAQQAANISKKRQAIYKRKGGEYLFGPDGTLFYLQNHMGITDIVYMDIIYPEGQKPKEKE